MGFEVKEPPHRGFIEHRNAEILVVDVSEVIDHQCTTLKKARPRLSSRVILYDVLKLKWCASCKA